MARLRLPVITSDGCTASSTARSRPANWLSFCRIRSKALGAVDLMDQPGAGNRAGIDHRIERPVVVGEPDRIERLAARLDADRGRDPLLADHFQRQRKHERLGHRLDGERHRAVADFVDVAVDGDERDRRNAPDWPVAARGCSRRRRPELSALNSSVATGQELLQRRLCGVSGISGVASWCRLERMTWASTMYSS